METTRHSSDTAEPADSPAFSADGVADPSLATVSRIAAVAGVIGIAATFLLGSGRQPYFSWLVAYVYFLSLALGALFFVFCLFVCRAGWAVSVRRIAENVMSTLPVFAVLFIPIWLGRHELYEWTHPEVVAKNPILSGKAAYLNEGFFVIRALIYFVSWSALATYFSKRSEAQDQTGDERITRRLQRVAAPGIVIFAMTLSFASIDWILSLEPEWTSTMFGVHIFAGSALSMFAFLVASILFLRSRGRLLEVVSIEHFQDLGKLLFGFTVFWTYIAFSQYLLVWYANIPEETVYYLHRSKGSWSTLSYFLALGHFAIPFFFFMPRAVKRHPGALGLGALWVLMMHFFDLYWCIMPVLHEEGMHLGIVDATAMIGVGGIFIAAFTWSASRRALIPLRDPRLRESLSFQNT